jgi:hypothetical protein
MSITKIIITFAMLKLKYMETLLIDNSSLQAQSFINFARTLPFVIQTPTKQLSKNIYQAAKACNATTVDAFFDELDSRIKKRFNNV